MGWETVDRKYCLLLNACLKNYLLGLPRKQKERLREKLEFLEAGLWDAGVRVKKLKGVSGKTVFEARLSRSERLLFTLGRHGSLTAIYLWGVVEHDRVGARAQRFLPENAPFLHFEPVQLEERAEMVVDELPAEFFSQEALEDPTPFDYGPQKWLVLGDEEWKRLLLAAAPDEFEIFLYLTAEQREVLEKDPPVLLSGTAGSGKTTISVYYLLKRPFAGKRRLYLTYSPQLNDFSKRIYQGLVARSDLEQGGTPPDFYVFRDLLWALARKQGLGWQKEREVGLPEFAAIFRNHRLHQKYEAELVWEEIRAIIKGAKPAIRGERLKGLLAAYSANTLQPEELRELKESLLGLKTLEFAEKILRMIERKSRCKTIDDFVKNLGLPGEPCGEEQKSVLADISKIVEKKERLLQRPLLTYGEYLTLGKKRAPNFLYERRDIYDIAEYYQDRLDQESRWDEIDLCRQALLNRKEGAWFTYDLVVCDEVQDFADIQLALIFRLARSHQRIVLCGDPKQIINPSGFRWEEVKDKFYERGVEIPKIHLLSLNFRCVGSIVKLANALLDLKQELIGLAGPELKEQWKFGGRPPVLLTAVTEQEILRKLHFKGAGRIIVVRDAQEQHRIKQLLSTELVFTIHEAKGLEFDTVLLWGFNSLRRSAEIWRRIRSEQLDRRHHPFLRHELNLLYVAVTRARNTLIIYDTLTDLWEHRLLRELVFRTSEKGILKELWQTISSPAEWEKQGDYFFEREYYPAAVECYRNAGNTPRTEIARAFLLRKTGRHGPAAELFARHAFHQEAAECYEKAGHFAAAMELWAKLKDRDRSELCRLQLFEQQGDHDAAAAGWLRRGSPERALENWRKSGNHLKIGEYFLGRKEYPKAAEAFEKARETERAAICYQKLGQAEKAAELYYRAGALAKAIPLYKKLKNHERLLTCYLNSGAFHEAGRLCEKNSDWDGAIGNFKRFSALSGDSAAQLLREAAEHQDRRSMLRAALRFSALGMPAQAAPIYFRKGLWERAATAYAQAGNRARAAECFEKMGNPYRAALEYEESSHPDRFSRSRQMLEEYLAGPRRAGERPMARLEEEAARYFATGQGQRALIRYQALEDAGRVLEVGLTLDCDEDIVDYFLTGGWYGRLRDYLNAREVLEISEQFLSNLITRHGGESIPYYRERKDLECIAVLLAKLLDQEESPALLQAAERVLSVNYCLMEHVPAAVLTLMLRVRLYSSILQVLKGTSELRRQGLLNAALKAFPGQLTRAARESGDPALEACYFFLKERKRFDEAVGQLELTDRNLELFKESRENYIKAVDFMLRQKDIAGAVWVCRNHANYQRAARIWEQAGDYVQAARSYRDGKHYEDALRCFRQAGDQAGTAQIYEKTGRLEEALAIWRGLGKKRDIKRVVGKMGKLPDPKRQLSLF